MSLTLKLFGGFSIWRGDGRELSLPTRKTCALLAYLAVNADRPQPRETLVGLLWGDRGDQQARRSLTQALVSIRKLADKNGETFLETGSERVTLRSAAIDTDIANFHALLDDDPTGAAALYEGPFLDGMSLLEPAFEGWLATIRSDFETKACDALHRAAIAVADLGDVDEAIALARRLVGLDPLREDGHRILMRLLHDSGDRIGALRQYQVCAEALQRTLQVTPDAETRSLYNAMRQASGDATGSPASFERAEAGAPGSRTVKRRRFVLVVAASVALAVLAGAVLWLEPWNRRVESDAAAQYCPTLNDKPSIAVLPFKNLSDDPKQEYFSDGVTEDIVSRLALRPDMTVASSTSSFAFKGKPVTVQRIGRELGVKYVLEGNVQRAGDRIRITAQLIETTTGKHLLARRYDRDAQNLFAMQDEIAHAVAVELAVKLTAGDVARIYSEATNSLEAYDYFLLARHLYDRRHKKNHEQARMLLEKAVALDPKFVRAIALLGWVYEARRYQSNWGYDPVRSLKRAEELAHRALAIDRNTPAAHSLLGKLFAYKGQYDQSIVEGKRAISIEPNNPSHRVVFTWLMLFAGQVADASRHMAYAICLSPYATDGMLTTEAQTYYMAGQYEAAIKAARRLIARDTTRNFISWRRMIASYMALGREAEARAVARKHNEAYFKWRGRPYSLDSRLRSLRNRPWKDTSWIDVYADRLRKAGIPD